MTAFDSWYATHIEANLPSDMPPQVREVAQKQAAKIWNAALDEAARHSYPMAQLIAARAVAVDELQDLKIKIS
jgi:hypothetical protein